MGKPLIMGRKTFESIGKPLPGRTNIIITRNRFYQKEEIHVVDGLESALYVAKAVAVMEKVNEIMVIGGSRIYEMFLPTADRLYVTEVHREVRGDVFFPNFDRTAWRETSRQYHQGEEPDRDTPPYSFVILDRKVP
ncbi:MAG TPA: dihydrofolate reductase, partial [Rhodospirillales bacterium]|nr:dihydrofolate reductase [Rhodospirillales bacterium]